jgi:hypothetical protein
MSLVKYTTECPACEYPAIIVVDPNLEPPKYCTQCKAPLSDSEQPETGEVKQ